MKSTVQSRYLVAGCKSWNRRVFRERIRRLPGQWRYVGDPRELTVERIRQWRPEKIFFLHWSWMVPAEVIDLAECVCFHMTDVPYGRGGSPLQNLIVRGHRRTRLTALRMTERFDAGPVYLKRTLSLAGSAQEILTRASELSADMIATILRTDPTPRAQRGRVTLFKRRRPADSLIPPGLTLSRLHDFIRMLDAEGYPPAFLEHAGFRFDFNRAAFDRGRLTATVAIRPVGAPSP